MNIQDKRIDGGKPFDWGKTSEDYVKYRDVYPVVFYEKIVERGLCIKGQKVLDLGTGTGVLPRNLYKFGAEWTGTDISGEQIAQAKRLSEQSGQNIAYQVVATEDIDVVEETFDVITACQCFYYFDRENVIPKLARMLKQNGRLLILYMSWLPLEETIAQASEELVLKYNPKWSGAGQGRHPVLVSDAVRKLFDVVYSVEYDMDVCFTRETWNGRLKATRGVGASLSSKEVAAWEKDHMELLEKIAPEEFSIRHQVRMLELKKKIL